jgi:hypothetical protein
MAEILIKYRAEAGDLEAAVNKINEANDEAVKSATKASDKIAAEYKSAAKSAAAAFSGGDISKALNSSASAIDNLTKKSEPLTRTLRGLKNEILALEEAGDTTSQRFRNLVSEAARLEDQIGDTRTRIGNLASDTLKFDAGLQAVQGLAAGFEVVQGTAALFGAENEDLQKSLLKVQGAMAVANGLQQISNLLLEESKLKTVALTVAQRIYTATITLTSGALKGLKVALAATGVGALIVALGAVVAYWDDIKGAISGVSSEQEGLNALANANLATENEKLEALDSQDNTLKLQGKSEKEILQLKIAQTDQVIAAQEEAIRQSEITLKSQIEAEKRNRNILTGLLSLTTQPLQALINGIDFIAEKVSGNKLIDFNLADKLASFVFDPAQVEAEGKKALEESQKALAALRERRAGYELSIRDIDKKASDDAAAKRKEASDKAAEAAKKAAEDQLKARERLAQLENEAFVSQLSEQEKLLNESNAKIIELEKSFSEARYKAGSAEAIQAEKDLSNAIETIKADTNKKIAELDKKDLEESVAKQIEATKAAANATTEEQILALQTQRDIELANAEALGKDKVEITTRYNTQIADLNKQLAQSEYNTRVDNLKALELVEGSTLDRRLELINIEAERRKQEAKDSIDDANERAAKITLIEAETQNAIREERKKSRDEQIAQVEEVAQATAGAFSAYVNLVNQISEQRINAINQTSELELQAINDSQNSEITKERQRETLKLKTERAIAKEKTKQAMLDKQLALFNAIISTAAAIAKVADKPILIALAAATGALQIATIAAQPIPKYARGGLVGGRLHSGGGTLIEAERDEYIINRGQSMKHRRELDAINTSSEAFRRLIDERYVRPAINYYLGKKERGLTLNASLNSKSMERELKGMRRDLKRQNTVININASDNRYTWQ